MILFPDRLIPYALNMQDELLPRMVRHLILNYSSLSSVGLLNGKMGGVLFFYLYARHTGKSYYINIADSLLDNVYEQLNDNMPVDFCSGLSGVGWGVEYLIQNKFVDADSDELLEDIDAKIMEWDVRRIKKWDLHTGLSGILYYVITRLESYDRRDRKLPFDPLYLEDLLAAIENYPADVNFTFSKALVSRFQGIMQGNINYATPVVIPEVLYDSVDVSQITHLSGIPIGIENGLTGVALKLILS
ncbi:lanthionine synthetase LanC family protein [Rikenella microfusus]|uniref:lanthionine synthetase LanC family protein n=2 Tax=Rikenella microfusus TaxID=28139 RepID=UPI00266F824C|nr:lanthionine synthetase LanC family protein [Rikenella microfusus]